MINTTVPDDKKGIRKAFDHKRYQGYELASEKSVKSLV